VYQLALDGQLVLAYPTVKADDRRHLLLPALVDVVVPLAALVFIGFVLYKLLKRSRDESRGSATGSPSASACRRQLPAADDSRRPGGSALIWQGRQETALQRSPSSARRAAFRASALCRAGRCARRSA